MLRWFLGLGRKPTFERWTYWEKFDYWMMYLAMLLIGTSGLMLWFPNAFSLLLPGQALNIAYAVHAETALLTASILLIIHLFNAHFRPEKFPMDLSFVTGLVSEDHLRTARPEYLDRLEREGQLEQLRVVVPHRTKLRPLIMTGFAVVAICLILLLAILLAALGK
jgi:cytochrome b subunit of formate dehydrogenase